MTYFIIGMVIVFVYIVGHIRGETIGMRYAREELRVKPYVVEWEE